MEHPMRRRTINPWLAIGLDAWTLGMESASVMGLRTMKIAMGGPAGDAESKLMVDEKVKAAVDLQTALLSGKLGSNPATVTKQALRLYSGKVRANRKRLSKV
jgi:hypothetical protein